MITTDDSPREDRIATAIAELLQAADEGQPLETASWISRYPEVADQLNEFLDDHDGVTVGLRSFRNVIREPNLQSAERFLGDYELVEKIAGNMGVVYRARQRSLPRDVAVKILLQASPRDRSRFRLEAETMAQLHHAHIARILEVSKGDGLPWFSMEWFQGGTLAARVADFREQPLKAVELMRKVALAIHYAHQRGILHRDLKPANILLDEFGEPRVADFGLALSLSELNDACGLRAGTPPYMAPEQLTGEVTVATDVYGLGAILYELLTGRAPSAAATMPEILERVRLATPDAPATLNPQVDPDLNAICLKCLAKDPSARYNSAATFAADLLRYQHGLHTEARPLGGFGRMAHLLRQARAAGEFRKLGPSLFLQSAFALATNSLVCVLLQQRVWEFWIWLTIFSTYGPLFVILARDRLANRATHNPARLQIWSIWAGHAAASLSVFIAIRFTAGTDYVHGIQMGYVACCGLNALAFIVMGSILAGRQYLLGFLWLFAPLAMAIWLPAAPIIYAVLMAYCTFITGLQLNAFHKANPS